MIEDIAKTNHIAYTKFKDSDKFLGTFFFLKDMSAKNAQITKMAVVFTLRNSLLRAFLCAQEDWL